MNSIFYPFFFSVPMSRSGFHLFSAVLESHRLLQKNREKEGRRPDRFVYEITSQGSNHFKKLLTNSLYTRYADEFELDAAYFFRHALDTSTICVSNNYQIIM